MRGGSGGRGQTRATVGAVGAGGAPAQAVRSSRSEPEKRRMGEEERRRGTTPIRRSAGPPPRPTAPSSFRAFTPPSIRTSKRSRRLEKRGLVQLAIVGPRFISQAVVRVQGDASEVISEQRASFRARHVGLGAVVSLPRLFGGHIQRAVPDNIRQPPDLNKACGPGFEGELGLPLVAVADRPREGARRGADVRALRRAARA